MGPCYANTPNLVSFLCVLRFDSSSERFGVLYKGDITRKNFVRNNDLGVGDLAAKNRNQKSVMNA